MYVNGCRKKNERNRTKNKSAWLESDMIVCRFCPRRNSTVSKSVCTHMALAGLLRLLIVHQPQQQQQTNNFNVSIWTCLYYFSFAISFCCCCGWNVLVIWLNVCRIYCFISNFRTPNHKCNYGNCVHSDALYWIAIYSTIATMFGK